MSQQPNLIYIFADDMGYGDLSCLNSQAAFRTPHLDQLAAQGMCCTDAHSSSAVCTPSRYSVLTGRYNWRSTLKSGVTGGYSQPIVEDGRLTVASMLKAQGYRTACVGKWHLGLNWRLKDGGLASTYQDEAQVDFAAPISNGPIHHGFDYFYGISASLDMPPYVYMENDRVTSVPTRQFAGAAGKKFMRSGLIGDDFTPETVLPTLTAKVESLIDSYAFRGMKSDIFEGGHRIPFVMRWPAVIPPGRTSDQAVCLVDLVATMAEITGFQLPDHAAEDSVSNLAIWRGTATRPIREAIVHHSINGSFSIRQGQWKLELCADSGGWSEPKPRSPQAAGLPPVQLYDLMADIGERRNVQHEHPDVVAHLTALLARYVREGRSTPGQPQPNTGPADWPQLAWMHENLN